MRPRARDSGFTITELMAVLLIIGVLAAVAAPSMSRDRSAGNGTEFARTVARELQRARMTALSDRLPVRAYFYANRLDIKPHIQDTPTSPVVAPTAATAPTYTVPTKPGIVIEQVQVGFFNVVLDPVSGNSTSVDFNTIGGASTTVWLIVRNDTVQPIHPQRKYRIDVNGTTGYVQTRDKW